MVFYIFNELDVLRRLIEDNFADPGGWKDALDQSIKENATIEDTIVDFFGAYFMGVPKETCISNGISRMIFEQPLSKMPSVLYADDLWKRLIAQWRLQIDK